MILLLTGAPGCGKTTLVRRVAAALGELRVAGFTTEEIRDGSGRRRGFRIVPLAASHDRPRVMAHVDLPGPARVGRYGVDVAAIDAVAEDALAPRADVDLHLVDEIGKMECLSPRFVTAMRTLLDAEMPVVATIALRGGGFIAEVKSRDDVEIREVRPANREALVEEVVAWIGRASGSSRLENAP